MKKEIACGLEQAVFTAHESLKFLDAAYFALSFQILQTSLLLSQSISD